mgnify:FL=1
MKQVHICQLFDDGIWEDRAEDWRIKPDCDSVLFLKYIEEYLVSERIQTISFDRVIHTSEILYPDLSLDNCICCNGVKHKLCNINKPAIVVHNMPNPYNKEYKLIDGKHRFNKMRSMGMTESNMYVLEFEEIKHLFKDINHNKYNKK